LIRLNELGLLKQLRRLSSVSGGSISAGHRAAQLARVKTALRDYGDETRAELVNWGYAVCDRALRRWHLPQAPSATGWPMPSGIGSSMGR
jgi:NTE family protein